ncbi:MAG TPA: SPFH domain-containing protein [Candidatus Paceibacterota bacterium]|nr:SPFH domain-containing protein [Candidatus Paceibacterota bacterium]
MDAIILFLFCVAVSIGIFYLLGMAVLKMAEKDICFTKNVSGWVKAVVAGDEVVKWIGWIPCYHVSSETGEILSLDGKDVEVPKGTSEEDAKKMIEKEKTRIMDIVEKDRGLLDDVLKNFGISFVGLWPYRKTYEYKFKWTEWVKRANAAKYEPWPREDKTKHVRFRFPYFIDITEAETKGKVTIDVTLLVTIRIRNASKALFKSGGEWLANVTAAVQSATRDWIGNNTLEDITKTQHESGGSGFVSYVMSLNSSEKGNKGLIETLGVEIDMVNFLSYEISGDGKERIQKATTEQYVAEQEAAAKKARADGDADATIKLAEAEARAIEVKGDAKAKAMEKMLKAVHSHPGGVQIEIADRIANGIQNSKLTTLVAGEGAHPLLQIMGNQLPQERERPRDDHSRQERPNKRRDRQTPEGEKNESDS